MSEKHGVDAENRAEEALSGTFFDDFVFRRPRNNNTTKRENTDILAVFDDVILVIESKSQASPKPPREWLKTNLKEAIGQIGGAIRAMNRGVVPYLENMRRGRITFNRNNYRYIYGLVLVNQPPEVINISTYIEPFIKKHNTALQVMSLVDFRTVCKYFDTAMGFYHYYDVRNDVGGSNRIKLHDEEEFLSYFINNYASLSSGYYKRKGLDIDVKDLFDAQEYYKAIKAGFWPKEYKYSLIIDEIIGRLHGTDGRVQDLFDAPEEKRIFEESNYADIAHEMAKTCRLSRMQMGTILFDLHKKFYDAGGQRDQDQFVGARKLGRGFYFFMPQYDTPRKETIRWICYQAEILLKKKEYLRDIVALSIEVDRSGRVRYDACHAVKPENPSN